MTAEVVILNREAVAIAADSAATVAGRGPKIYNTANKLFPLSAVEPVAVMFYGAGAFGPVPWETVVKEYRRTRGAQSFETVAEYAADFIEHLSDLTQHVSRGEQRERVAMTALWELEMIRDVVEEQVTAAATAGADLDEATIIERILDEINTTIEQLEGGTFVDGLSAAIVGREIGNAVPDWSDFVAAVFRDLPTDARVVRRARVLVRMSLRLADRSPGSGGVVVAGFGESEIFPALSHYLLDGVVANRVRAHPGSHVRIDGNQSAGIYPFAQEDMVATFMDGVHPGFRLALDGFVDETVALLLERFCRLVEDSLPAAVYEQLQIEMQDARDWVTEHVGSGLNEFLERNNSGPIMSVVEVLPKEELAEMAEALVNLTSFKRRVTPGAETVGGPIDVAVISKGDGLVWIKRKHYFDPELNHRYFDRDRQLRGSGTLGGTP
ncbi:MAG: hypothetical protein F4091_07015 [Acidimicrobiales bacterium]|nr:hypothetical protein [Acidimicrobiales bacterium]MYF08306.1 hypothetical protein [Rhodospirillaceae bacterium]MYJ65198.1 hypothetical protein [Acidimicrobiales bacterium]